MCAAAIARGQLADSWSSAAAFQLAPATRLETSTAPPPTSTQPSISAPGSDALNEPASATTTAAPELDQPNEPPTGWEFRIAPYIWPLSVSADIRTGPISTDADACVTDLLRNLDLMAQLRLEGLHRQRWGFFLDGTYVSLSTDASTRVGRLRLRTRDLEARLRLAWLDFGGMYRFGKSGRSFDAFVGGRVANISTDVSLGRFVDLTGDSTFVTPVLGGRFERAFTKRWSGSIKGEIGGFGTQGADLYWSATAALGYQLSEHTALHFGYRVYNWDYAQGRRELDLMFHGPIIGLVFRF